MSAKVLLLLFAVFACVFAQNREDKRIIDPFTPDTDPIIILIQNQNQLPITEEAFTRDAGIMGGERDLSLTAESGNNNLVLTAAVTSGQWSVSTPNSARGFALMQYDGVDGSTGLAQNGLGAQNLVSDGGDSFRLLIQSDIETLYTFFVYSNGGSSSEFSLTIPGDDTTNEYFLAFDDFQGNADFTNVGAIEILIEAFDNVDTFVELFHTSGLPVPTPSPVPSPPANPSRSATPTPEVFTWYTFDDDDDGVSPCGDEEPRRTYFVSDNNIVYYYFYGFEEPIEIETASSASMISVMFSMIIAAVALVM